MASINTEHPIYKAYDLNGITLKNRFLMAPMTRPRASQPGDIPNVLMAEYYGQRASAGVIVTEATQVSLQGKGYANTPGIYTTEQVRLSPFITFKDMVDPEILETIMIAAEKLNELGVTYIHLCEADWDDAPEVPESFRQELRSVFKNTIVVTGNYTPERAKDVLCKNYADLVGFGRMFLTNPDYPAKVAAGAPLNDISDTHVVRWWWSTRLHGLGLCNLSA